MTYATKLAVALWEEVGIEVVLLTCFCLGFSILRSQRKPIGCKKISVSENAKRQGSRPLSPENRLHRAEELLNDGKGGEALSALTGSSSSPLPGSILVALFEALRQRGNTQHLLRLPQGAITAWNGLALAQHATSRNYGAVREVHHVTQATVMTTAIGEALLKAYASCGEATAPEVLESLLELKPSEAALLMALGLCAQSQSVRMAERLAIYAKQKKGVTLPVSASLLKVYSQAKLWDKACSVHQELKNAGVIPDTATYGALIKAAVEAGRHQLAQDLFQESKNPDAINVMSMIRAAGRAGDVPKALELLRQLELSEKQIDTTTYNCALEACVAGGDRRSADTLLQQMVKVGHVDVVSYNTYIKLLLQGHLHKEVHKTLQDMRKQGIPPNVVTYNSIIKEAAARDITSAWDIAEEMQREGIQPDAYTAILGAGLRRQPSKAGLDRVLALTSQLQPDEVLVNCLLDICIRLKDRQRLRQVLLWRADLSAPSAHAFVMLIRAFGHAQQMDEAWKIWRQLLADEKVLTEDIFMSMVDACLASSDMRSLLEVFQEVRSWLPGFPRATVAFSLAVKMAMQLQQLDLALELYEETTETIILSVVTYNTLIDALVQSGALKRAMELFHDMTRRNAGPDLITFSILVKGFASAGDLETSLMLLGQMRCLQIQPDSILFNTILNGCAKRQMRALTEQVLAEMENAGVAPSNFTLSILIKLYGRCGDLKAAFGVVEEYPKRFKFRLNAQVYTCLMSTCIWSGDLPMAFDVYQTMLQDGCLADGKTFDTLLMGCLKHQDARRALQVVREAAEFGVSVNPEMLESAVLMAREYGPELGQSCQPRSKK